MRTTKLVLLTAFFTVAAMFVYYAAALIAFLSQQIASW
jgi:hypothetical protein